MRLFPAEPEIADDEGFTPENDIFRRKEFGERLTRLVRYLDTPSVVLLDAPWGSGKTTFVKMWRGELRKLGVACVYFDAFANDYQSDAFLALASQIVAEAEAAKPDDARKVEAFKTKAVGALKVIGRGAVKIGVKAATAGLVDADDVGETLATAITGAGEEAAGSIDEALKKRLDAAKADKTSFASFRQALSELSSSLGKPDAQQSKDEAPKPLVFIIDELDRCRPSFALEMLELIKHFFNAPNVAFVLVSNLPSLERAARHAYGNMDTMSYLEKFYQVRITLPFDLGNIRRYLDYLQIDHRAADTMAAIAEAKGLSFRTIQHVAAYYNMFNVVSSQYTPRMHDALAVVCVLRVIHPTLYNSVRKNKCTPDGILGAVDHVNWPSGGPTDRFRELMYYILHPTMLDAQTAETFRRSFLNDFNTSHVNLLKQYADAIENFIAPG